MQMIKTIIVLQKKKHNLHIPKKKDKILVLNGNFES